MVLLAMSVLALTIVIIKLWQFRALRIGDLDPAREAAQLYCRGPAGRRPGAGRANREPGRWDAGTGHARATPQPSGGKGARGGHPACR